MKEYLEVQITIQTSAKFLDYINMSEGELNSFLKKEEDLLKNKLLSMDKKSSSYNPLIKQEHK